MIGALHQVGWFYFVVAGIAATVVLVAVATATLLGWARDALAAFRGWRARRASSDDPCPACTARASARATLDAAQATFEAGGPFGVDGEQVLAEYRRLPRLVLAKTDGPRPTSVREWRDG